MYSFLGVELFTNHEIKQATSFLTQVIDIVDRNIDNQDAGVARKQSGVYTYDEEYTSEHMRIDLIIPHDYGDAAFIDDFTEESFNAVCLDDVDRDVIHIRITRPWS
jgi:hypothetical protein